MAQTVEFGNFDVGDVVDELPNILAGRQIDPVRGAAACRKAVRELSNDYAFQGLQNTGPNFNFTSGVFQYTPEFFKQPSDAGLGIRRVISFFMYYTVPFIPAVSMGQASPGINLKYVDPQTIENYINVVTLPTAYTRFNGNFLIGPCPDKAYTGYMRYQLEHAFPNAGIPANELEDVIFLDNDWQDIVEYATAMRYAIATRLLDYAKDFREILYGDPKFQLSGGQEGQPGLIFRRVSMQERYGSMSTKRMQVVRG